MLHRQAENLWTADHELRLPGGIPFATRMTVVRLADGSLALISPVPIGDALASELAALGPVSHLIAPNLFHHLHLAPAKARYREARLLGPAGLAAKKPGMAFEPPVVDGLAPFQGVLASMAIEGAPRASETVWFHITSRTLIVTELVFNFEATGSWKTAVLLACTGVRGRLAQSRIWNFLLEDKALASASCQRMFNWDFDRLIVAHGNVIASGAKPRLASALTRTPVSRER
jgi:hypothetical protein